MSTSEATPRPANAASSAPSLRRPLLQWAAATAVLLFTMFLVIQDLSGANRPHELTNAPWVAGITLLNLVLCGSGIRDLVRYARARGGWRECSPGFYALGLGLLAVSILDALLFVAAAETTPAVLGS